MAAYLVVGLAALLTGFAPVDAVQVVWLSAMIAPLVWPRFAKLVGIRPLWGSDA